MRSNSYDEMKDLLKKSKFIFEQSVGNDIRYNPATSIQTKIENGVEDDKEEEDKLKTSPTKKTSSKYQKYKISGGILVIHGDTRADVDNITTDDKTAFQTTMDEFIEEVSDLVDFEPLHIYSNSVEWGGKLIDNNISFIYNIGESGGVYVTSTLSKVDEDYISIITKLEQYYQKFKSKWSNIISNRKKTMV